MRKQKLQGHTQYPVILSIDVENPNWIWYHKDQWETKGMQSQQGSRAENQPRGDQSWQQLKEQGEGSVDMQGDLPRLGAQTRGQCL